VVSVSGGDGALWIAIKCSIMQIVSPTVDEWKSEYLGVWQKGCYAV
jgi:hypothetical protein